MAGKPTIKLATNEPLLVKGLESLQTSEENTIDANKVMAPCQCGESKTKPF